jgi:hypothetical protein
MGQYTITLSDEQETALQYATEMKNSDRANQTDEDGNALAPLAETEVLDSIIAADLANWRRTLDAEVARHIPLLKGLSSSALTEVLDSPAVTPAQKAYVQKLLVKEA